VKQSTPKCDGIRVAIVDATRLGSESLAGMLKRSHCLVVWAGTSPDQAIEALSEADVGLISSTLEGQTGKGFELALRVRKSHAHLQIVIIADSPDPQTVVRAFQCGARGVFSRDSAPQLITKCVSRVHEGQVWASTEQLQYVVAALTAPPRLRLTNSSGFGMLSPREEEVVHWVADGSTNREIAEKLGLSENTVKNYLFRIFEKLGISSRVELILYASSQFSDQHSPGHRAPRGPEDQGEGLELEMSRKAVASLASPFYLIADAYRCGRGVQQDKAMAVTWFVIAEHVVKEAANSAVAAREQLERELPRRDVVAAKRRAAEMLRKRRSVSGEVDSDDAPRLQSNG
jgi:DNA-binding NarL/FixJ family response regulator